MLQRTLLVLLIATCTLSSGCATVRRELGYALISDKTEIKLGAKFAAQIEAQQRLTPTAASNPTSSASPRPYFPGHRRPPRHPLPR